MTRGPIKIPAITADYAIDPSIQEDLEAFYNQHFSPAAVEDFVHRQHLPNTHAWGEHLEDEDEGPDDGLGFYSDGTKRTLTDEQIAMFQHSEIQSLLRARRLAAERKADHDASSPEYETVLPADRAALEEPDDDDDEREYEAFLAREREDLERASTREQRSEGRGVEQVLLYDDEDPSTLAPAASATDGATVPTAESAAAFQHAGRDEALSGGRKRVWYGDVDETIVDEDTFDQGKEATKKIFLWPTIKPG